jgi:lipoyl(octanoyl) transferase
MSSSSTDLYSALDAALGPEILIRRHTDASPWTYSLLDAHQRRVAERVRAGGRGTLILSELAPVITLGRRTAPGDLLLSRTLLAQQGVEVLATDRGGLATYHGPGQWVLFAVDRLDRLTGDSRGVRRAVEGLLEVALTVGHSYDPSARIREGAEAGVWSSCGKFSAVGIHIAERVLLHGISVNGFQTPLSFLGIRPCGLDADVDFLLRNQPLREEAFVGLGEKLRDAALRILWKGP